MKKTLAALAAVTTLLTGCSSAGGIYGVPVPGGRSGDVIVVDDERGDRGEYAARRLGVPKGHFPPPGECRVWYPGTPPGQQPPPSKCDSLLGRVPYGAFVLYNGKEWDSRYDWGEHERRNRGSVPGVILELMRSIRQ